MLSALQGMDAGFLLMLQNARTDWLDQLAAGYTALGNGGMIWIAVSLAMLCHRNTRPAGMLALCAMLLGLVCTNLILKPLVMRPRPWLDVVGLIPLINEGDPNSFPSGHTCAAFAAAMIFWRALPSQWLGVRCLLVVMAVCMGLSRLYVGVHYPSDVLAGALVGSLCAWTVWYFWQMYQLRHSM